MTTTAQSTDKCPDCKRPIHRSALQLNKLYCWFCRKYVDKAS